ncbi:hypothetical protein GQ457_11G006470 [Hibiscus cannabinus]
MEFEVIQSEDFHYMDDDLIDDMDEDDCDIVGGHMDAHEYDMLTKATDTSSVQAWNEKNIQYKNYENIPTSGEAVNKVCLLSYHL